MSDRRMRGHRQTPRWFRERATRSWFASSRAVASGCRRGGSWPVPGMRGTRGLAEG